MDPQLIQWLNFQVTIKPYLDSDVRGKKLYGSPRVLSCYASGERKMVRNLQGEEVVSTETLYFTATPEALEIGYLDEVTFPDGLKPSILAKQVFRDEQGEPQVVEVNF